MEEEKYYTAEQARADRKGFAERKKKEEFRKIAETETFQDKLEEIKNAAMNGETHLAFLPHSTAYYEKFYVEGKEIPQEARDFDQETIDTLNALTSLGFSTTYIDSKNPNNTGIYLKGMNPMNGDRGIQVAQANILWG